MDLQSGERLTNQVSVAAPPGRRQRSLRRTSSLQSFWPSGVRGPVAFVGRGRDLYTGLEGAAPRVWSDDQVEITLTLDKRIERIDASRQQAKLAKLAGKRPGGELRKQMAEDIADEVAQSTILHRLLDDLAGATFLAPGAWLAWLPGGAKEYEAILGPQSRLHRTVEGLCISYTPGSPSMTQEGRSNQAIADHPHRALPFRADDSLAWHEFACIEGPNLWRIRQMDLWLDNGLLHASAGFQDSAALANRLDQRAVFHEYRLTAVIDPEGFVLRAIDVTPGILPFRTCLAAPDTAKSLIGKPVSDFRRIVPAALPGIAGCTHLNEALRALQDLHGMANSLRTLM